MKKYTIECDKVERIDKFVSENILDISRSYIQKLIEDGSITVFGKKIKPNYKTKVGDIIDIKIPKTEDIPILPQKIDLDILYEDDYIIVINKPRGMVVHPAAGNFENTLVNGLLYHTKGKLSMINGEYRSGIVHRIDKDTTGLLVVAKNDEAYINLAKQLKERTFKRQYLALVHGNIRKDNFKVDAPITRDDKDRKKMCVKKVENAKDAITHITVLERFLKYTLILCQLETGRTHQIRVHMKYINHPIVGDKNYGIKEKFNLEGQLLHAKTIGFIHPKTGEYLEFSSSLPKDFNDFLCNLRKNM